MKPRFEDVRIRHYPDPVLRKKAVGVTQFDAELADLADQMFAIMAENKGVGLAAPQVGQLIRMFVMNPTGEPESGIALINPELHDVSGAEEAEEGCLSLPGIHIQVRRATEARLTFQDLTGAAQELEGVDLIARIWQHELDHLNGVLILDRMGPSDRIATRKTLQALEEGYRTRK